MSWKRPTWVVAIVLMTCAVTSPLPLAGNEQDGTIIFYRPAQLGNVLATTFWIDGTPVGRFKRGASLEVTVSPGSHQIHAFYPASIEKNYLLGKNTYKPRIREITVAPGETIYMKTDSRAFELVEDEATALRELHRCKPVEPTVSTITGNHVSEKELAAWKRCSEGGLPEACNEYLNEYPDGAHAAEVRTASAQRRADRRAAARAREDSLPLKIRIDKYTVSLTNALKYERYDDALEYFRKLESLDVVLPQSFTFFHGEALLRTGRRQDSLEKFYDYIEQAGPEGEHYRLALRLSNEAEGR